MDESEHETAAPVAGKRNSNLVTANANPSDAVRDDSRQEDERMLHRSSRDGVATIERDLVHVETEKVHSLHKDPENSLSPFHPELKPVQATDKTEGYPMPQLRWAPSEEMMMEITESSSATEDDTPGATREFIREFQKGSSPACPRIPLLEDTSSMTGKEKVNLLLRSLAWSQDSLDQKRQLTHRPSLNHMQVPPNGQASVHKYRRSDSLLIDSQNSINEHESPTSTWVYWEEKIVDPVDLNNEE